MNFREHRDPKVKCSKTLVQFSAHSHDQLSNERDDEYSITFGSFQRFVVHSNESQTNIQLTVTHKTEKISKTWLL